MKRSSYFLPEPTRQRLRERAKAEDVKVAELVRRFIEDGLARPLKKPKSKVKT